jgi:signal transduction histidine kinase
MTIRVKLALLYGVLFMAAGVALVGISYQLVARRMPAAEVAEVSGKDVTLRAAKMAADPDFSALDRAALKTLSTMPPDQTLAALKTGAVELSADTQKQLTAALPVSVRADALHQLLVQSAWALGLMAVVSLVLGWFVAGRVLRPLARITDTARRLSASNLEARIDLDGPNDELTVLARTFDEMLDRLAASFDGQRLFVANASHELRTPLTIMATEIDVTLARPDASVADLRAMAVAVRAAVDRSDRIIESMLTLASVERGLETATATDLAEVVRDVWERRAAALAAADIEVSTSLSAAPIVGDPALLDQLVDNLVDNGIHHNVAGGWLRLATRRVGVHVELEVASSGATVADAALDSLFLPFRRADRRTGSGRGVGLGLSIVLAIAQAHGGSARATPVPGGGLVVVVEFPADGDASADELDGRRTRGLESRRIGEREAVPKISGRVMGIQRGSVPNG